MNNLATFDITNKFAKPFTMALIGATQSGKTYFLNHLLPLIRKNFDIIIFSSINAHCSAYDKIRDIKNVVVFDKFNGYVIKKLHAINKKTNNFFKILVLIDDDIDNKNNQAIKNLFSTYRNSNFSTIYSGQNYTFIAKSNRNNINYTFILKQGTADDYTTIGKMFINNHLDVEDTKLKKYEIDKLKLDWLIKNTQNHNMIVINNFEDKNKIYRYKVIN